MADQSMNINFSASMDVSQVMGAIKTMQGGFNSLKIDPKFMEGLTKEFNNLQGYVKDFQKIMGKENVSKTDIKNLQNLEKAINSSFANITKMQQQLSSTPIMTRVDSTQLDELVKKTDAARKALNDAFSNIKFGENVGILQLESSIEKAVGRSKTLKTAFADAFSSLKTGNVDQFIGQIDKTFSNLESKLKSGKLDTTAKSLIESFKQLGLLSIDIKTDTAKQKIEALKTGFDSIKTAIANGANGQELQDLIQKLEKATAAEDKFRASALQNGKGSLGGVISEHEQLSRAAEKAAKSEREFQQASFSASQQVQQLQQSTQYFFGLRNMINLLKRGVSEAVDTIKQLDAAMTQTAVVTDFSVGDMWKKLPQYTANANALGASVKDMYEATTLYYQQGLNTEQSMNIAAETMKMARIGGLEAADATDKMTAALRGFNMELNEASAQRVNDVYSNLAAKTASNTEELGTAMQRTASIAASAGMSFEGTAAFLAQAIETTREPAENLGTAMKTIVARFTELKKNPLEIAEVDGEEVSYNKVDTALQSIGVSLKDTNGQFRALDQVFLDISEKWDGLTQTQQRYIATTAAGSRQQSRFIAMMDNYERTVQLMDYANNSAGASSEQFGKTLESLEAKINKFKNAWQQFLMGIMNDSFTKGIVDGATKVLDIVNTLINKLTSWDGSGVTKSLLSIVTAFTALKGVGRLANKAIGGLGGLVDPTSSWREGFRGGAIKGGNTQARAISDPIVAAINRIYGKLNGVDSKLNPRGSWQEFKNAQSQFRASAKSGRSFNDIFSNLQGLDKSQVNTILSNNPAIEAQFRRSANKFIGGLDIREGTKQLTSTATSNIIKNFKQDPNMSPDSFIKAVRPDQIGKQLIMAGQKEAGIELMTAFNKRREFDFMKSVGIDTSDRERATAQHQSYLKSNEGYRSKYADFIKGYHGAGNLMPEPTKMDKLANAVGTVGSAFGTAGQAASTFGMILSNLGLEGIGSAFMSIGSVVSSVGATIGSFAMTLSMAGGSLSTLLAPIIPYLPVIGAAAIAIGGITAALVQAKKEQKQIVESAEKVTSSFKDTQKNTQDNIASLKAYREELATLSKGVDSNGNNINLSDTDYARYLEIVDDIASMNPEIVKGYNAQGHAIIANNEALEKTLEYQTKLQKNATKKYLDPNSLQKLVSARNINKDFYSAVTQVSNKNVGRLAADSGDTGLKRTAVLPMTGQITNVIEKLKSEDWFDAQKFESQFGTSLDNINQETIEKISSNKDAFNNVMSSMAAEAGETFSEDLSNSIEKWDEKQGAFDEAIQPVYEWLATSIGEQSVFKELPNEVVPELQKGLKSIAGDTTKTSNQMITASKKLLNNFNSLTNGNKKYKDSIDTVTKAQETYANTLDEDEYRANIQPAIDDLNELKEQATKMGGTTGNALAEFLENQIAQISRFAEDGGIDLGEALNTAVDDIASAESALENFSKATEKDFWTAAEGMKSIYDKVFETYKDSYGNEYEKHTEGMGDNTFWEGAKALLSEDALTGGVETVSKRIKNLEPVLRDGQEGVEAFYDSVVNNDAIKKMHEAGDISLDEDGWFKEIPEEQWSNVADALGYSEDLLTSMLNKARQFGLISFDNLSKVREALSTSESVIQGTSTQDGKKSLYVKEDTLRAELAQAGYNTKESQDAEIQALQKEQNVRTVKTLDKLDKTMARDLAKDWGISNLPDLITKMSETGEYNKEEIADFAEKSGLGTADEVDALYDGIVQALENPEIAEQTSELRNVNSKLDAIQTLIANSGDLDKVEKTGEEAYNAAHREIYGGKGVDTQAQYFSLGQDTSGNLLDASTYATTKAHLQELQQSLAEKAATFAQISKTQNEDENGRFNQLSQKYQQDANKLQEYINSGTKAWEKGIKEREKVDAKAAEDRKRRAKQDKDGMGKLSAKDYNDARDAGRRQARGEVVESKTKTTEERETHERTTKEEETTKVDKYEAESSAEYEAKQEKWEEDKANPDIKKTATYNAEDSGLSKTDKKLDMMHKKADTPATMTVEGDAQPAEQSVEDVESQANSTNPIIKIDGDNSSAISAVRSVGNNVSTVHVPVRADFQGSWTKTITIEKRTKIIGGGGGHMAEGAAHGKNNYIPYRSAPVFGSLAKGSKFGTLGPTGRGGLTLTGEKGFEIAWLPSENRSMILGTDGPQMLNLPSDAVVYTHEQSKDILKQKGIPAGSHSASARGNRLNFNRRYSGGGGGGNTTSSGRSSGKGSGKSSGKAAKKVEKVSNKVYDWWEAIDRRVKNIKRETDKWTKALDKRLGDIRATTSNINNANQKFLNAQKRSIAINTQLYNSANQRLNKFIGKGAKYEKTVEWGSGKDKKSQKINLANFVIRENGAYVVSQQALSRLGNSEQAKAIQKAAYEEIDKYTGKRDNAEDAINEARDAIAKYRVEIDNIFFGWINELNEVYKISHKIELTEARINKERSKYSLAETKLGLVDLTKGLNSKDLGSSLNALKSANKEIVGQINTEIGQKKELQKANSAEISSMTKLSSKGGSFTYRGVDGKTYANSEANRYEQLTSWAPTLGTLKKNTNSKVSAANKKAQAAKKKQDQALKAYQKKKTKANLAAYKKANSEYNSANKALTTARNDNKAVINAENALKKAEANVKKAKTAAQKKNAKKELDKAKKQVSNVKKKYIYQRGSGQWWDELSDQDKKLYAKGEALNKYLTKDKNGIYQLNTSKIESDRKAGKITKEQYDLMKEFYDDLHEKQVRGIDISAELYDLENDRINQQEAYKQQIEDIRSSFFDWEITLTKVLALTTKIEQAEKRIANLKDGQDYYGTKRAAGLASSSTKEMALFRGRLATQKANIKTGNTAISQQKALIRDRISGRKISADISALNAQIKKEKNSGKRDVLIAQRDKLKKELDTQGKALQYGTVALNSDGTVKIDFDENKLRSARQQGKITTDEYADIETYWNNMIAESGVLQDLQNSQINRLTEIYQELIDLKQQYADRAKELREAYIQTQEKQLNNTKALYTALDKSLTDLINKVKESLSQRRQTEDNKKTEADISKKQQRLAALRAGTAGGNQTEIAQLEKEISDAQQSYGRSIEDQLLNKISQQGSEASKQRQKQIDLLTSQHEIAKNTGIYAKEINKWLSNPSKYKNNITSVLKSKESWASLTAAEKVVVKDAINTTLNDVKTLPTEIKAVKNTVTDLKSSIKTIESMMTQMATGETKNTKVTAAQIKSQGLGTKFAKQQGTSAKSMKAAGFTAKQLKSGGYTAKDIKAGGYSAKEAISAGYSIKDLKGAGYTAAQLRQAGQSASTLKKAGFTAKQLKAGGYNAKQLKSAGFSAKDLKNAQYSVADIKGAGYSAKQMKDAGYSAKTLYKAGYSVKQLKGAGYSAKNIKDAGATIQQARSAGYSVQDVIKAYGTSAALKAGYGGATIQQSNKASAKGIQTAINKNIKNKNVTQTDMAKVATNIDINGSKKGGVIGASFTTGGKFLYGNSGSTLYGQAWNPKTSKATGKVYKVSIGNLTAQHFKNNKKEATEALVYAITHQKWGSKINKNFKALVKAAGISGKQYKLSGKGHDWYASVGGDGIIYQNQANGVGQWNPATGKATLSKYNKSKFLQIAKRNNGPSREYAQVLMSKKAYTKAQLQKLGVKQFETGGLADFTGPAWLDGTSSKPELVLNAQDTKNFLMLKDILSKVMSSASSVENTYGGDSVFEININVDHINNDYDVDRLADRIKRDIIKDSNYRNVTQVRKFR